MKNSGELSIAEHGVANKDALAYTFQHREGCTHFLFKRNYLASSSKREHINTNVALGNQVPN